MSKFLPFIFEPTASSGSGSGTEILERRLEALASVPAGTVIDLTADPNFNITGDTLALTSPLDHYTQFILAGSILDLQDVTRVSATQIQLADKVKPNTILRIRYVVPN